MEGLPPPPAMPPLTVPCVDGSVQTFPAPTFSWIDALTRVKGAKCGVNGLAPPPPIPVPRRDHTVPFAAYEAMDEVRCQTVGRGACTPSQETLAIACRKAPTVGRVL